jgi:hypothetical protein
MRRDIPSTVVPRRLGARSALWDQRTCSLTVGVLLLAATQGCFLRKYVYHPVPVANAIGDSTTTVAGTVVHVYVSDTYELYGPTAASIISAAAQLNRSYREFAKHFGAESPRMAIVLADSAFALSPVDVASFAKRHLHTFVYVRPHNLRDIEGVPPDLREEEIWPVSGRAAREMLAAYVNARRHRAPTVESTAHKAEHHIDPFPVWFVDAVVALLSDPGAPDRVMDYLRDRLGDAPPLTQLLDMPAGSDSGPGAGSREQRAILGATGVALTLFAVEREGPRIVGRVADTFLSGESARQALRNASRFPQNDYELERVWRTWVRDEYGR